MGHLINFSGQFDLQNDTYFCKWVQSYSVWRRAPLEPAVSHCFSLIFRDFFAGWRKGELWMPFVSWTKKTAWTSLHKFQVWIHGLPFFTFGFSPECSRLLPQQKVCGLSLFGTASLWLPDAKECTEVWLRDIFLTKYI